MTILKHYSLLTGYKQIVYSHFFIISMIALDPDTLDSTKHFNKHWLLWMRKYQPFMPETTIIRNAKWFEYVFNEENPGQSTFRCRLCYRNYDAFKITTSQR